MKRSIAHASAVLYVTLIFSREYTVYATAYLSVVFDQYELMYHECVRGTSVAPGLGCVGPSCVAHCWSVVRLRVRAYYTACNSSWGFFCHKCLPL
jgi:hypothetical protein